MASLDHIELANKLTLTDKEPPKYDKQIIEYDSDFELGEFHQYNPVLIATENASIDDSLGEVTIYELL